MKTTTTKTIWPESKGRASSTLLFTTLWLLLLLPSPVAYAGAPDPRRSLVVKAVEQNKSAVVNISTEQFVRQHVPGPAGDLFDQFYRDFFEPNTEGKLAVNSLGSGVVFDDQGDVLTNYHVIARGARIKVGLADGRELTAEVVGTDPDSDIAVLRVLGNQKLPKAVLGTSNDLIIGETAIAIGNPFGLSHSVTTGVISALRRSVRAEGRSFYDFIQTDAAINPGNSGGPLLNINGEVVGINTAIYAEGHGIGFAIPIDRAKTLAEEILRHGEVREAWLGVSLDDPGDEPEHHDGTPVAAVHGLRVVDVEPHSPAAEAGLQVGDLLMRFADADLQDAEEFRYLLRGVPVGQNANLAVIREGKAMQIQVGAAEFPLDQVGELVARRVGLEVSEVNSPQGKGRAILRGVVVSLVREGSPAAHVGLMPGDVVRAVNSLEITTLDDFRKAIKRARRGGSAVLLIQRGHTLEQIEFPF
jgi:Do/DeqQ family serine protease